VLLLVVAALVSTGVAGHVRDRASRCTLATRSRRRGKAQAIAGPASRSCPRSTSCRIASETPFTTIRRGSRGPTVSRSECHLRIALAAIAAILKSGAEAPTQISALLVFSLVAFVAAEIPLVSFAVAPEATRARVDQLYTWVSTHQRLVVTILASVVGVYLTAIGISKL